MPADMLNSPWRVRIVRPRSDGEPPMLVTFHSKACSSITMFGVVAVTLLKMAGHSGIVPGALLAGDVPSALARIKQDFAAAGLEGESKQSVGPGAEDADNLPPVGLRQRSYPLIQLLSAAVR